MSPWAVFRADAGPELGGGHAQRCLALAEALSRAGWRVAFAVREPSLTTVPQLERSFKRLFCLHGRVEDEAAELASFITSPCDLLVVDHYGRDHEFEKSCRRFASRILVLDDSPSRKHDCDLLLDPTPGRQASDYLPLVPSGCKFLLGPDYALLRSQFAQSRRAALVRRGEGQEARRLLVSLGMTDPSNFTSCVLEGVAKSDLRLAVDVILGSAAPHLSQIGERVADITRSGMHARLHVDVADMAGLLSRADLAIGAAGQSSFERCCLGLPSLIVVAAENQRQFAAALVAAGAAESLGEGENLRAQVVAEALLSVFTAPERQRELSAAAAALCDGLGAARVASLCSAETSAALAQTGSN